MIAPRGISPAPPADAATPPPAPNVRKLLTQPETRVYHLACQAGVFPVTVLWTHEAD